MTDFESITAAVGSVAPSRLADFPTQPIVELVDQPALPPAPEEGIDPREIPRPKSWRKLGR
ncbi:hypothetical protein [Streptomyces sp. MUM 178J]|uniref:hypothetical protein n=1 Tax=Streptomyces sp. MUM 178J TaxID=2791991 RepID=UPI001F04B87E|nr:hypothetical protein [Streptomyces sp. MUM 178J]WRQ83121.1 hypothetical protein I3F59_029405 [Streptomyces sp. MUM 178J]